MIQSVSVYWNHEAYLASGTTECFTKFVLYAYIFKTHLCNHCMGISIQFNSIRRVVELNVDPHAVVAKVSLEYISVWYNFRETFSGNRCEIRLMIPIDWDTLEHNLLMCVSNFSLLSMNTPGNLWLEVLAIGWPLKELFKFSIRFIFVIFM